MKEMILPFRLNNIWLGLELGNVNSVDSCGKMSLTPNNPAPLAGLMQKNGKILPIWSLYSLVGGSYLDLKKCTLFIEVSTTDRLVIIPVDEILSMTIVNTGWISVSKYGLKLFRYLDKKKPPIVHEVVEEIQPIEHNFEQELINHDYILEEIKSTS